MPRAVLVLVATASCYHAATVAPCELACDGTAGSCPSELTCSNGLCALPGGACGEVGDAGTLCFGQRFPVCVPPMTYPSSVSITAPIDTDTACTVVVSQGSPSPNLCVIVGDTVTVGGASMTITASGSQVLVLLGLTQLVVDSVLDVGSHQATKTLGPAANTGCDTGTGLPGSGGGGAGGSFITSGGAGGGSVGGGGGQATPVEVPTKLHGGCPGQAGADLEAMMPPSMPGAGGGAVYLVSGGTIMMTSSVLAGGAGGDGGFGGTTDAGGGGGGGAGGMIVVSAPMIPRGPGQLSAGGGGGGAGAEQDVAGDPGGDGSSNDGHGGVMPVAGGAGATGNDDGGSGATTSFPVRGGGGGGGGTGLVFIETR